MDMEGRRRVGCRSTSEEGCEKGGGGAGMWFGVQDEDRVLTRRWAKMDDTSSACEDVADEYFELLGNGWRSGVLIIQIPLSCPPCQKKLYQGQRKHNINIKACSASHSSTSSLPCPSVTSIFYASCHVLPSCEYCSYVTK
jgi:hypothetical protein